MMGSNRCNKMPYRYLEEIAIADVAIEAWGTTIEELFTAAADAAINVMVGDLDSIANETQRYFRLEDSELDMLLFKLLQELIFLKDAQHLLLRVRNIRVQRTNGSHILVVQAGGERIDPARHELIVDVKAVTLHRLRVEETGHGWVATVILDV